MLKQSTTKVFADKGRLAAIFTLDPSTLNKRQISARLKKMEALKLLSLI